MTCAGKIFVVDHKSVGKLIAFCNWEERIGLVCAECAEQLQGVRVSVIIFKYFFLCNCVTLNAQCIGSHKMGKKGFNCNKISGK